MTSNMLHNHINRFVRFSVVQIRDSIINYLFDIVWNGLENTRTSTESVNQSLTLKFAIEQFLGRLVWFFFSISAREVLGRWIEKDSRRLQNLVTTNVKSKVVFLREVPDAIGQLVRVTVSNKVSTYMISGGAIPDTDGR